MVYVLFVCDDLTLHKMITSYADRHDSGLALKSCTTVNRALLLIDNYEFDCIIADFHLPDNCALDLLAHLESKKCTSPVILLAGDCNQQQIAQAYEAGAQDCYENQIRVDNIPQLFDLVSKTVTEKHRTAKSAGELSEFNWFLNTNHLLLLVDSDSGNIIQTNEYSANQIGVNRFELIGANFYNLLAEECRFEVREKLTSLKGGEELTVFPVLLLRSDKSEISISLSAKSVAGGKQLTLVGKLQSPNKDVPLSSKQHLEKFEQENHRLKLEVSELKSVCHVISHDFKSPLRRISEITKILIDDLENEHEESLLALLRSIERESGTMRRLMSSLMKLMKITQQPLAKQEVNLSALVNVIIDQNSEYYKSTEFELSIDENILAPADPVLIMNVLDNIVSNAFKYCKSDIPLKIEFGEREMNGQRTFYLKDNGLGISPKNVDNAFDPFCRLHEGLQVEGEGLGLAIAKRIVMNHGGNIWLESIESEGSTFYFTLGNQ